MVAVWILGECFDYGLGSCRMGGLVAILNALTEALSCIFYRRFRYLALHLVRLGDLPRSSRCWLPY